MNATWAVLIEVPSAAVASLGGTFPEHVLVDCRPGWSALVGFEPGSSTVEDDVAEALSARLEAAVYALALEDAELVLEDVPLVGEYRGGVRVRLLDEPPHDFAARHGCLLTG